MLKTNIRGIVVLLLSALALSACAGSDFTRPDPAGFTLGQTTSTQVEQKMGDPYRRGEVTKNGKLVKTASYAYASGSLVGGLTPARSQGFYFLDDVLVGTEFASSFENDSTNFDETRVARLVKGQSKKADVIALFGAPGGEYISPLVTGASDRALVYLYSRTTGTAFNLHILQKQLVVTYDRNGIVTDINYTSQGQ